MTRVVPIRAGINTPGSDSPGSEGDPRDPRAEELAARLRQAVQGCTLHLHGPVMAWWTIEQAVEQGDIDRGAVLRAAVGASERRLATLRAQGVDEDDPRVRKEIITARFMARLFGGETAV
ncbi:MAG: hypothetical protein KC503_43900 [Myxococcales bacterium]|nr:hypothetical protein [Myxococcales bacterium]